MPFTRQARRLKENISCSSRSQSQELEKSLFSTADETFLEMNANEEKIVTTDETFADVSPEENINNIANIDAVGNIMEKNNNNQKTDEMVESAEENNNEEDVKVAATEDIKADESLDDVKIGKWSGGVEINLTAGDGEQKDDDAFEDEKMIEKDFENNYENISWDHEETISVSASDMVDSSEVEWEEVVMENVEEVVVSVTTPTTKKKLDENDQDDKVQVLTKDNVDDSHHSKEFDKKLKELDSLAG